MTQAASLSEILTRRRTTGETTYMAFIDFKKANDLVPHEVLKVDVLYCRNLL